MLKNPYDYQPLEAECVENQNNKEPYRVRYIIGMWCIGIVVTPFLSAMFLPVLLIIGIVFPEIALQNLGQFGMLLYVAMPLGFQIGFCNPLLWLERPKGEFLFLLMISGISYWNRDWMFSETI